MKILLEIRKELQKRSEERLISRKHKFFQCHKGGYGEGDKFLGVDNPNLRAVAKVYRNICIKEITALICSEYHEERLLSLLIMDLQYTHADKKRSLNPTLQQKLYTLYLEKISHINNWDLVDLSAPNIIGKYLLNKDDRKTLYSLATSNNLWQERIAILSTLTFIRNKDFTDTFKLAEYFLPHPHDLMHKAIGWMLREIGKKDLTAEETFLTKHYQQIPRTSLRYAIEKFPENKRQKYLKGKI